MVTRQERERQTELKYAYRVTGVYEQREACIELARLTHTKINYYLLAKAKPV